MKILTIRIAEWLIAIAILTALAVQVNEFEPELVNNLAIKAKSILMD